VEDVHVHVVDLDVASGKMSLSIKLEDESPVCYAQCLYSWQTSHFGTREREFEFAAGCEFLF